MNLKYLKFISSNVKVMSGQLFILYSRNLFGLTL